VSKKEEDPTRTEGKGYSRVLGAKRARKNEKEGATVTKKKKK